MKKSGSAILAVILLLSFLVQPMSTRQVQAKTVKKTKSVGTAFSVAQNGCVYTSSNKKTAYVSDKGIVTVKRKGTVMINVKKGKKSVKKIQLIAKNSKKTPQMGVCADEVAAGEPIVTVKEQEFSVSQKITNKGSLSLKKTEIQYQVNVDLDTKTTNVSGAAITTSTKHITPILKSSVSQIKKGNTVTLTSTYRCADNEIIAKVELQKNPQMIFSTMDALVTKNLSTGSWRAAWNPIDTVAPVFSGLVGSKAYNKHYKDYCITVYKGKTNWLLKYVSAKDARDGKVKVTVDTSSINWKKQGIYTVTYRAKDSAGNEAKKKTKVQVRVAGSDLDRYANNILKKITKESWSDEKKARAIYRYVRGHMVYIDSNEHRSWERSGLYALRYHSGNCFVYYSLARLLLTRAGIVNETVTRYKGHAHHWWNYVYLNKGWYHFDTTPRHIRANFCLWTAKQLTAYSNRAGNSHIWNPKWIPASAVVRA